MKSLGKVMITPQGAYNSSKTYTYLDIVIYENYSYACNVDECVGVTPGTDPIKWVQLTGNTEDYRMTLENDTLTLISINGYSTSVTFKNAANYGW